MLTTRRPHIGSPRTSPNTPLPEAVTSVRPEASWVAVPDRRTGALRPELRWSLPAAHAEQLAVAA